MNLFSRTLLALTLTGALILATYPFTPKETFDNPTAITLPNDCAITATEVYRRLHAAGVPARLFAVTFITSSGELSGHMVTVWQPFPGSSVLLYDLYFIDGTFEFTTIHSLDPDQLGDSFAHTRQFRRKARHLLEAHFIQ